MDLSRGTRITLRWWWLLALCGVVAAVLALAISSTLPRDYESRSMLLVGSLTVTDPTEQLGYQQLAQTYATLAETAVVLRPVAATLGLDVETLGARVAVESVAGENFVDVGARGSTPEDAQAIAAAIAGQITLLSQTPTDPPQSLALIIEEATLPATSSSPSTIVNVLVAAVLGVLVGALLAFAFDGMRARRAPSERPSTMPQQGQWPNPR